MTKLYVILSSPHLFSRKFQLCRTRFSAKNKYCSHPLISIHVVKPGGISRSWRRLCSVKTNKQLWVVRSCSSLALLSSIGPVDDIVPLEMNIVIICSAWLSEGLSLEQSALTQPFITPHKLWWLMGGTVHSPERNKQFLEQQVPYFTLAVREFDSISSATQENT